MKLEILEFTKSLFEVNVAPDFFIVCYFDSWGPKNQILIFKKIYIYNIFNGISFSLILINIPAEQGIHHTSVR